ncbi:hypothetical protein EH233_24440 [Anabaena sp. YBS01]|nr:hypothetical protein EH233_24440 [Anabaena sp. YBS01]
MVVSIRLLVPIYLFYPPNTAANRPATGWFLFLLFMLEKKKYFMLGCLNANARKVYDELAT